MTREQEFPGRRDMREPDARALDKVFGERSDDGADLERGIEGERLDVDEGHGTALKDFVRSPPRATRRYRGLDGCV